MTDYLDMVQRKSAVDQAMEVWKERRAVEWKRQDDNWEKEYDARIAEEARKAKEEGQRVVAKRKGMCQKFFLFHLKHYKLTFQNFLNLINLVL